MARILIVDDDPSILILTKRILEKENHEMVIAKDGQECLEILGGDRPDLILLDVMLPGQNGWEVCKKIKKDPKTKNIPVVMFTVHTSRESVEKSLVNAHADAQINKPFEIEELIKTVEEFLKK